MFDYVQSLYGKEPSRFEYSYKSLRSGLAKINKKIKYYKRNFLVKITDYLPEWILGMTDCIRNIWINRRCGYRFYEVLRHEINHILHPAKGEYEIQRITAAGEPRDLNTFDLIFV